LPSSLDRRVDRYGADRRQSCGASVRKTDRSDCGGRFLARGMPEKIYEAGLNQRTVIIEFPSVAKAIETHDSPGYQAALKALGNAAERDLRIVEGVD
jgi:uncharacterized protein (DUF1330 family)